MKLFNKLSESERKEALNNMLWTFGITVFAIGCIFFFLSIKNNQPETLIDYTFVLEGEEMDSLMVCENYWHYELIDSFIPCVVNKTIGGIGGGTIDWSLSPQENCNFVEGEFPGLNLYNETRAKELYDQLLPRCFEFRDIEITNIWLNVSECVCLENKDLNSSFTPNCDEYDCGDGLLITRK